MKKTWLLGVWLCWSGTSYALDPLDPRRCTEPEDIDDLLNFLSTAEASFERKDYPVAERQFRGLVDVLRREGRPRTHWVRATIGLSRSLEKQGRKQDALEALFVLESLRHHCVAEERARLLLETDLDGALEALQVARDSAWASEAERGRLVLRRVEIVSQTDPVSAGVALNADRWFISDYLLDAPDSDLALVFELATVLWEARWERVHREGVVREDDPYQPDHLLDWVADYGNASLKEKVKKFRLKMGKIRSIEAAGGPIPGWNLDGPHTESDRVRELIEGDELAQALRAAEALVESRPSAESLGLLGDVYARKGNLVEAYRYYAQAASWELVPGPWHTRWLMSRVIDTQFIDSGRVQALELACRGVAPEPELLIELAGLYAGSGEDERAREAYEQAARILGRQPEDIAASRLSVIEIELNRLEAVGESHRTTTSEPVVEAGWEQAVISMRVAWTLALEGDHDLAAQALKRARRLAPEKTRTDRFLALQGAMAWFAGDVEGTIEAWKKSLSLDDSQRTLWLDLAQVYLSIGELDNGREALEAAGDRGVADAWFLLALLEYGQDDPDQADIYLNRFEEELNGVSTISDTQIAVLKELLAPVHEENVATTVRNRWMFGVLGLGVLFTLLWFRGRKANITSLLEDFPECSHDLARILSAIRHEVLKHNTTLLDEVADALEHGDHHAVSFAAIRIYGMPNSPEGGIPKRFEGYLRALERVGRRYHRRLDVRRGDPVLGPMCKAMEELQELEPSLRRPWRASGRAPDRLRRLSTDLNQTAYRAIGSLLQQMGTLWLNRDFIEEVNQRVCAEPGVSEREIPSLEIRVPDAQLPLRIFHGDLQDILANLIRNALNAGVEAGVPGVSIRVEEEDDPITGMEHVAIRVLDRAPGRLSTGQLHGRSIGRGLGLTADLIARHEGSMEVEHREDEAQEGWAKAVVLRLRRVEAALDEALPRRARVEEVFE